MTTTLKTTGALLLAAVLTGLLFLSPVGVSNAQDDATEDGVTEDTEQTDRPQRQDLTDEEREALQAERQAAQQTRMDAFAAELGVTSDEVVAAARTVLVDELDAKVAAGDLTEERAEMILSRFDERDTLPLFGGGHGGHGGPGHRR